MWGWVIWVIELKLCGVAFHGENLVTCVAIHATGWSTLASSLQRSQPIALLELQLGVGLQHTVYIFDFLLWFKSLSFELIVRHATSHSLLIWSADDRWLPVWIRIRVTLHTLYKRVVEEFLPCYSLFGIWHDQPRHQVICSFAHFDMLRNQIYTLLNLIFESIEIFTLEGWLSSQHFIEYNADRP